MKNKFRRILSLVTAVAMTLSIGAMNTFAITEEDGETITIGANSVTVEKSTSEQTVNVSLFVEEDAEVSNFDASVTISDEGNVGATFVGGATLAISDMTGTINLSAGATTGGISVGDQNAQHKLTKDDSVGGYVLVTIPISIPANASGTVKVNFTSLNVADFDNASGYELSSSTATSTITVTEPTVEGYTAQVTADSAVTVGDTVNVYIGVGHDSDTIFHAAEIVLKYDSTALELVTSSLGEKFYTNADGELKFEDFDSEHNMGTGAYTIQFKALKTGDTTVTLDSAKFLDKAASASSDLIGATITTASATVQVSEVKYNVTVADGSDTAGLTIPEEVTKGEDLVINAADTNLWNYTVGAQIGNNPLEITKGDGTFTISKDVITGDIVLTTSRTAKQFDVEWTGDGANDVTDKAYTATYNTDFSFTVPAKVEATATVAGVNYSATVSIEGSTYNASAGAGETVTIPGDQITGKVTISVDKEELAANGKTISISGEDVKFDDGTTSKTVSPGTELTVVLTPETGYTYVVKVGDEEVELTDNQYTLTVGDSDVTINVEKTLITDGLVNVYDYVTLDSTDGEHLWLVTFAPTLAAGKIPTYDGNAMYWSAKYNAYCYLVKATSLETADATKKLDVTTANATSVDYTGNVNNSTYTDAADAQFVANMYNAMYSDIDNTVTMAKFLSADMNTDHKITIADAQTIVKQILGINN